MPNLTNVLNFTAVLDRSGTLLSSTVSLVSSRTVEAVFRLSNGELTRSYTVGSDPEIQVEGNLTVIRDHVIILNDPSQPIGLGRYVFSLSSIIFGSIMVVDFEAEGLVEVVQGTGGWCIHVLYLRAAVLMYVCYPMPVWCNFSSVSTTVHPT